MAISSSATAIQSENDFNQAFKAINNNSLISIYEKEQLLINFLNEIEPTQNNLYSLVIAHQLHYFSLQKSDTEKTKRWLSLYNQLSVKIKSKKSVTSLNFLAKQRQLLDLRNQHKNLSVLSNAAKLLAESKELKISKDNYVVNNELRVTEINIADIHKLMGTSNFSLGNYDVAHQSFITASKIYARLDNLKSVASSYNNLSVIRWAQKDFQSALEYLQKKLKYF